MPASYLGIPTASGTNAKVLSTSEYQRELNGLELLTEVYTLRSENRISLQPARNTAHSAFSTAALKYPRMAVENVSFREQRGGLTEMTVEYVGLTSSTGLPPPVIRLIPVTPAIYIEAEYVTDQNEESFINLGNLARMPASLNGYAMPPNPPPAFTISNPSGSIRTLGYCYDTTECRRRGQFLIVRSNFRKKTIGIGAFAYATDI